MWNPQVHVDLPQLVTEASSKTPLRKRGWQDALESVYPFKINRLAIHHGDVVYIDTLNAKPLHLANLNFVTDNIRNIHEPNNVYPSSFSGSMKVFGSGRLTVNGRAYYLIKPYPGMVTNYVVKDVPLSGVTPASRHVNIMIMGGSLSSNGTVEYSPTVTNVKVHNATIDSVNLSYVSSGPNPRRGKATNHQSREKHTEAEQSTGCQYRCAGTGHKDQPARFQESGFGSALRIVYRRYQYEGRKFD
jgi:hypothetical protein